MWEDLGGVKFCNTFRVDRFLAEDKDTGLGDVMVSDHKDGIEAFRWQELGDKVDCDSLEW